MCIRDSMRATAALLGVEGGSEVAQQPVCGPGGLHLIDLGLPLRESLLRLGGGLLGGFARLVHESHCYSTLPESKPPSGPRLSLPAPMFLARALASPSMVMDWRMTWPSPSSVASESPSPPNIAVIIVWVLRAPTRSTP